MTVSRRAVLGAPETRVAATPETVRKFLAQGLTVAVERGA